MNTETKTEANIGSSARPSNGMKTAHPYATSIGTKTAHPYATSIEAKIETIRAEIRIGIAMNTRTHLPDVMMVILRRLGTAAVRVAGMVESISG
jgi:hypothetical protein